MNKFDAGFVRNACRNPFDPISNAARSSHNEAKK
jgi:hypothetical protein